MGFSGQRLFLLQILIMIVVIIQMSQQTCARNETVQKAIRGVKRIIDVFQNGFYVMETTTAEIIGRFRKILTIIGTFRYLFNLKQIKTGYPRCVFMP